MENIDFYKMSIIYGTFPRKIVDDVLKFNLEICFYCRYEGSKGAIFNIDFDHISTMPMFQNDISMEIIGKMKETGVNYFFLQKDISPFSFIA